jgi:hypothetical protein
MQLPGGAVKGEETYVTYRQVIITVVAACGVLIASIGLLWQMHEREHTIEHGRLNRIEEKLDRLLLRADRGRQTNPH